MRFGSCFTGFGGLDLGLERAGMECAWQIENEFYAVAVLEKQWPRVPRENDIREVDPEGLERVDVVVGGFPCQDVSYAGKGEGIAGARSGLWKEMVRLLRVLRPPYVLVENTPGLLRRGMGVVLGDLWTLGYDAEWESFQAASLGALHLRDRVFIVAYAGRERLQRQGVAEDVACQASQREGEGAQRQRVRDAVEHGREAVGVGHADSLGCVQGIGEIQEGEPDAQGRGVGQKADTDGNGQRQPQRAIRAERGRPGDRREAGVGYRPDARSEGLEERIFGANLEAAIHAVKQRGGGDDGGSLAFWREDPADEAESPMGRVAHGFPGRVEQLKGLGNAVVPFVAETVGLCIRADAERWVS